MRGLTQQRDQAKRKAEGLLAALEEKAAEVKAELAKEAGPLEQQIKSHEDRLRQIGQAHKTELLAGGKTQTVKFSAGTMAWIKNRDSVEFRVDPDEVVAELEQRGFDSMIKVDKSPIKATMMQHPEDVNSLRSAYIRTGGEKIEIRLAKV